MKNYYKETISKTHVTLRNGSFYMCLKRTQIRTTYTNVQNAFSEENHQLHSVQQQLASNCGELTESRQL